MKSQATVTTKMKNSMTNAGAAIKDGFTNGTDPMDVISQNIPAYGQAMATGVSRAVSDGTYAAGINTAKQEGRWRKSSDKAVRNYANSANMAVENYMKRYPERVAAIEAVVKANPAVPGETRQARIARGGKIQEEIGQAMDRLYNRKV
ncbi:MAG: hypothetical protein WC749_07730 [Dehalococcoidia bacterium]